MFDVNIWGTVAEWFAAIGTVGAVVTTLWLVRRGARERAEVLTSLFTRADKSHSHIEVEIRNTGERTLRIATVTLGVGVSGSGGSLALSPSFVALPARLEPGDNVRVVFNPTHLDELREFAQDLERESLDELWVEARTALGAAFRARVRSGEVLIRTEEHLDPIADASGERKAEPVLKDGPPDPARRSLDAHGAASDRSQER